jgi:hypothetical protein
MLRNTLVALAGRSSPNAGHGQLRSLLREPRRNRLSGRLVPLADLGHRPMRTLLPLSFRRFEKQDYAAEE